MGFYTAHAYFFRYYPSLDAVYSFNSMQAKEVRILYRDEKGFTQVARASDLTGIAEMTQSLGYIWMEGHFGLGDPLLNSGAPKTRRKRK